MKALPIPFQGDMIRALLREIETPGTGKTLTRRLVKFDDAGRVKRGSRQWHPNDQNAAVLGCPYGVVGDLLYVKEAWRVGRGYDELPGSQFVSPCIWYSADGEPPDWAGGRYRHARFMPRWASRITLRITYVSIERLQDISDEDARAEGIEGAYVINGEYWRNYHLSDDEAEVSPMLEDPIDSFRTLWESINGPESWDANPYVWRIEFAPVLRNVDEILREAV